MLLWTVLYSVEKWNENDCFNFSTEILKLTNCDNSGIIQKVSRRDSKIIKF